MVAVSTDEEPIAGVLVPRGYEVGTASARIRGEDHDRPDVVVVASQRPATVAGVFTRNRVRAAPVVVSELAVRRARPLSAVVFNSGNANACTGSHGMRDALAMCAAAADGLGVDPAAVAVCSTGVIGRPLDIDRVVSAVRAAVVARQPDNDATAARAIMTTDRVPKRACERFRTAGRDYRIGGMAKGAGMIHPDMATLLALVTTDAPISHADLQAMLTRVADDTFNCITVDGDSSTNDTLLALANGAGGGELFMPGGESLAAFELALHSVCSSLAEQIVADGEGATKHFRILVRGAANPEEARIAARTVAGSALVKTAIHGADPNWGRIVAAVGRSGAEMHVDRCSVTIGGVRVFDRGLPIVAALDTVRDILGKKRIDVEIDLGSGDCQGHARGCDLSPEYVHVNADYTS